MPSSYLDALCTPKRTISTLKRQDTASSPAVMPNEKKQSESPASVLSKSHTNIEYMLINTNFGSFRYSNAFKQELTSLGYVGDVLEDRSSRLVLDLFDEKGSEWSSGKFASLKKVAVPAGFSKYVTTIKDKDQTGESFRVDFDRAFVESTQSLMKQRDSSMDDVRDLRAKVEAAKDVWKNFCIPLNDANDLAGLKTSDYEYQEVAKGKKEVKAVASPKPSDDELVAKGKNEAGKWHVVKKPKSSSKYKNHGASPKTDDKVIAKGKNEAKPMYDYILINTCYGGFTFSDEFEQEMKRRGSKNFSKYYSHKRRDPQVLQLFDEKGSDWSGGFYSRLEKVAVPAGYAEYAHVHEYDGLESLQSIDFDRVFTEGVKKLMDENHVQTLAADLVTLQSEIDAAKEVWEHCKRINGGGRDSMMMRMMRY